MTYYAAVLFSVFLFGCGALPDKSESDDDSASPATNGSGPAIQSMALNAEADLPVCDEQRKTQLVYLIAEKKFKTCDGAAWQDIEIAAPASQPTQMKIEEIHTCSSDLDLDSASDVDVYQKMAYFTKFTNGDWSASCLGWKFDSTYTYTDTSSMQFSLPAESTGIKNGVVGCLNLWTAIEFNIANKNASIGPAGGSTSNQISCTQIFP